MGKSRNLKNRFSGSSDTESPEGNLTAKQFLESEHGLKFKQFLEENNLTIIETIGELIRVKDNGFYGLDLNINSNFLEDYHPANLHLLMI